ncbi:hypothetical protein EYM_00020 [Ignicoccus islandicus DSM 13165]|uniref:Uncharacterized protein n=1 Tax=Ignicoccus islandicus DSM 13165 TaxID=940295 RepID=A0A0U3FQA6_9CREN|nr:hypothetical protein [Ignicoccus islandicus]ALU12087.1 hypothetical protein EYM_00020 [Ignicoccus islandicus DSM 13165]
MKLRLSLDLEDQLFLEEKVRVAVLKEVGSVFDGEEILRLGAGTEIDVPRWLAQYLVQRGYAKILNEVDVFRAAKEVSKFKFLENKHKESPYPVKLPSNFYKVVKQVVMDVIDNIDALKLGEIENITNILNKAIRIKNDLEELTEIRIMKLFRYLLSEKELSVEIIERLTPEEVILSNVLSESLKQWFDKVLPRNGEST